MGRTHRAIIASRFGDLDLLILLCSRVLLATQSGLDYSLLSNLKAPVDKTAGNFPIHEWQENPFASSWEFYVVQSTRDDNF